MPDQLWAAGYRVDPADCAATTYLQDVAVADTTTGVVDTYDGSGIDCFDPMIAQVTAVLDHGGFATLAGSETWRVVGRGVIQTGMISCVLPPETTLADPSITVLVEGYGPLGWVSLGGGVSSTLTYDYSGTFAGLSSIRYLRVSARFNYYRQGVDNAINIRVTDLRDNVTDYVAPDPGGDPPAAPVLHTPVLETGGACEGPRASIWCDADPDYTGLQVYRYDAMNPLGVLVYDSVVPTEEDPFVDAPLIVGVEYTYRATATSAGGTSDLSDALVVEPCPAESAGCSCPDWTSVGVSTVSWERVGCQ